MRVPARLQLRFLLASILPMLALLATAWAVANWTFTRSLEQRVADQLRNAAEVLTQGRLPLSPELLQRMAALQQAEVALLDARGEIAAGTPGGLAGGAARSLSGAARRPNSTTVTRIDVAGVPSIVVTAPLREAQDSRYASVLLAASLQDARGAARRAALFMGLAFVLAGALLSALMLYLVRGITTPIARLVAMADAIAAGRRDVSLPPEQAGEIGAIARALNELTTRLSAYEDELAARSRSDALGELSARIAHEIRNPLTALQLQLQLLAEGVEPGPRAIVARLLAEVRRLELIVSASLTQAQTGARVARLTTEQLQQPVTEVLDLMEPSLQHRGIALQRALATLPATTLDRDLVKQALLNLLTNAADELEHGGTVRVSTQLDPTRAMLLLVVEDSGPGIPRERREPLLAGAGSAKPFGLGLGLKVCREAAAAHGGRLEIGDSATLGGARIELMLPLAPGDAARG